MNRFTQNLMAHFPSWMKLAKDPDSIGAQFLDVFGLSYHEFESGMNEVVENFYATTADTEMVDWLFKIPLQTVRVDDAEEIDTVFLFRENGDPSLVMRSENIRKFYNRHTQLPTYWIDRTSGYLYLRVNMETIQDWNKPFQSVSINGAQHYEVLVHHVWNAFDEFGLLVGLTRLPREQNAAFKERILDVFKKPGTLSRVGVKDGLARELGISSNVISINPLSDETYKQSLTNPDGTPTVKLMQYAKQVNETLKFTWDTMNFGEAYWFSIEQDNIAISYLPHVWDVDLTGFKKTDFQSGVGYGDDLLVHKPKKEESFRDVKVSIGLMGYVDAYEEIHPEITFTYKIYAQGKILQQEYKEQAFRYTVKAAEAFEQSYQVRADADFEDSVTINLQDKSAPIQGSASENLHVGSSTDFLHTQTDRLVRLSLELNKFPDESTPKIKDMEVVWEDTTGVEHKFPFKTEDDFLIDRTNKNGNPMTNVVFSDVAHNDTELTLGVGAFYDEIDKTEEWRTGTWEINNIKIDNGAIRLNLDRFNPPGLNGPIY